MEHRTQNVWVIAMVLIVVMPDLYARDGMTMSSSKLRGVAVAERLYGEDRCMNGSDPWKGSLVHGCCYTEAALSVGTAMLVADAAQRWPGLRARVVCRALPPDA